MVKALGAITQHYWSEPTLYRWDLRKSTPYQVAYHRAAYGCGVPPPPYRLVMEAVLEYIHTVLVTE